MRHKQKRLLEQNRDKLANYIQDNNLDITPDYFVVLNNFGFIKFLIKNRIEYVQITLKGHALWKELTALKS